MNLKEQAAVTAVDLVKPGMLLGLGTGSTAALVVREIGRRLQANLLRDIRGVPTSQSILRVAREAGVPILGLEEAPVLDLTLDGADEVDPQWNLIKGGGGSLLREKITAQTSRVEAIVVDESKLVAQLGEKMALPLEVIPFGWNTHQEFLRSLGGDPLLRLAADGSPFITDEGNYTLDVRFAGVAGKQAMADLPGLDRRLRSRAGIVETGLFLGMASILIVGRTGGVEVLRRTNG